MKDIMSHTPRLLSRKLTLIRDSDNNTAADLADEFTLKKDYIDQAGYCNTKFYHLEAPPKVLIFYSTKERLGGPDGSDAETEKNSVENFFAERNFPILTVRDPTSEQLFSNISSAREDAGLSGLIVFIMSHGTRGLIQLSTEGKESVLRVDDIISHMNSFDRGKPKVR